MFLSWPEIATVRGNSISTPKRFESVLSDLLDLDILLIRVAIGRKVMKNRIVNFRSAHVSSRPFTTVVLSVVYFPPSLFTCI